MKNLILALFLLGCFPMTSIPQNTSSQASEYVTIRWAGRENTYLVRSNAKVEFLGPLFAKVGRPERVDERSFYMNIAMNAVAKEGYEFAGMTNDEIVMKRTVAR